MVRLDLSKHKLCTSYGAHPSFCSTWAGQKRLRSLNHNIYVATTPNTILQYFFFFNRKLIFPLKTDTFPSSAPGHLFTVFPINSNRTFSDCPHILQETIILTPLLANTAKFWVNLFHFLLSVKICVTYLLISFFVFSFAFLLIRWSQWRISQEFIKLSSLFQLSYILGSWIIITKICLNSFW